MNANLDYSAGRLRLSVCNPKAKVAALFVSVIAFSHAQAQSAQPAQTPQVPLSYTVTDFGTLGGSTSTASAVGSQQATNTAGLRVGSSTTSDNSEHAFLFVGGQIYDLNFLCDLSTSNFKVLTAAKTIDDCFEIVGEGITLNGDKHAFVLTPTPVDGGRWCYRCCQWVWKQEGGGWEWDTGSHSYTWHGPPGDHSACPPNPPHCFWWPLPCPDGCGCDHWDPPPPWCYCCINGHVYIVWAADCPARGGQCYDTLEDAIDNCVPREGWCCLNGNVVKMTNVECRKKGGQWFASEEEAIRNCKACWWCCLDGKIFQTTWADCQNKGGQCYPTEDEAKAHQKECTPKGWCCFNGEVFPSTPEECHKKGGQWYASQKEAIEHCKPCWCCFQGREGRELVLTTEADCQRRGGQCYSSPEEARRHNCIPKQCWVCIDNKVVLMSAADAQARNLECYASEEEARSHCISDIGWCCVDTATGMSVVQKTKADCEKEGGRWYKTREEAANACKGGGTPPPLCWVCIDRNVVQISAAEAQARKLRCFTSKEDAQRGCVEGPTWWCCIDGKVVQVPEAQAKARARSTQCYRSEEEARAHCKEKTVWCCMNGQVVQVTEAECRERGGQAYRSEKEARARCGGGKPCWVCVDGRAVQLPEAQARARGLQCFGSREEATRNCRPKESNCWVCINGRVGQMTEAQARARGLQCFSSREEAARNCSGGAGSTRPTPKSGRRR